MEPTTALISLDTNIVSVTKRDQAVWILSEAVKQRDDIINRYSLLEVVDDETKVEAEKGIMLIRTVIAEQDAGRKEWGRPLDLAKKTMDKAMGDHIADPETEVKDRLGRSVDNYVRAVQEADRKRRAEAQRIVDEANAKLAAERKAAEDKARAEAGAKKIEYVPPPVQGIPEIVVKHEPVKPIARAEGMKYRRWWLYKVVDWYQVPDAYTKRVINDEAVKTAIKAATTKRGDAPSECTASIPGITIYYEDKPA